MTSSSTTSVNMYDMNEDQDYDFGSANPGLRVEESRRGGYCDRCEEFKPGLRPLGHNEIDGCPQHVCRQSQVLILLESQLENSVAFYKTVRTKAEPQPKAPLVHAKVCHDANCFATGNSRNPAEYNQTPAEMPFKVRIQAEFDAIKRGIKDTYAGGLQLTNILHSLGDESYRPFTHPIDGSPPCSDATTIYTFERADCISILDRLMLLKLKSKCTDFSHALYVWADTRQTWLEVCMVILKAIYGATMPEQIVVSHLEVQLKTTDGEPVKYEQTLAEAGTKGGDTFVVQIDF